MSTNQPASFFESTLYDTHVCHTIEDTFILLDALEEDADALRQAKPLVCLEIGCVKADEFSCGAHVTLQLPQVRVGLRFQLRRRDPWSFVL